jgi:hypothetical protein
MFEEVAVVCFKALTRYLSEGTEDVKENVSKGVRLPEQPTDISDSGDILFSLSSSR